MPFSIRPYRRIFAPSAVMPIKFLTGASLCLALSLLWTPYDALARGSGSSHSSRSHSSAHHSSKSHAHPKAAQASSVTATDALSEMRKRRIISRRVIRARPQEKAVEPVRAMSLITWCR